MNAESFDEPALADRTSVRPDDGESRVGDRPVTVAANDPVRLGAVAGPIATDASGADAVGTNAIGTDAVSTAAISTAAISTAAISTSDAATASTASTTIRELGDADVARWDAFVVASPDATFFHRAAWRGVVESVFGHRTTFLYAERAGRIVGVLPLARQKSRLFGDALISLPFCVYGGVAADDAVAADALLDAAEARADAMGVGHLECRNLRHRRPTWSTTDLYVTFRQAILADHDANLLAIPRKQRAMVRKGIKAGLSSTEDGDLDRFFSLYADNVHRHGTPAQSRRYFETLVRTFGDDCRVTTVVTPQGKAVSSVLSFHFRDEVLPYYAGDALESRETAANDFKYWELMRRAAEDGRTLFDYGRSKVGTGPYDFKRNWGFVPQPLAYEYKLVRADRVPENNPLNPKYRAFIALWRKLPLPVANRLGPLIARSLG